MTRIRSERERIARPLPRDDEFLLVPARERRRFRLGPAPANVELVDEPARPFGDAPQAEPAEAGVLRLADVGEDEVLGQGEVEHETVALAILRDVPEPGVQRSARARVRHVLPGDDDAAPRRMADAGNRVDELRLAVAVDPGDADDLAAAHLERDAPDGLEPAVVEDAQALHLEQDLPRARRALLHLQEHLATDHEAREALLARAFPR